MQTVADGMGGQVVPPEEAAKDGRQELPEGAAPDGSASPGSSESPLERLASFRFAYVAIVLALLAYVFTVEGLEAGLQAHFSDAIEAAVRVDPADGPVADQIAERVDAILRDSRWVTWGDVRVRPLVLAADGYTLLYAGGSSLPRPPPGIGGAEDAHLLPAIVDVDVSVPHNALLANVVLVFYATLLITSLVVWTRRLAARENQQLMALADTRDELASRADGIEDELQTVRRRLEEVEPENEIYAEEIDALVAERQTLQERLSELEQREDSLRAKAPSAQDLADEQRALEELLDDATRDLESRDAELEGAPGPAETGRPWRCARPRRRTPDAPLPRALQEPRDGRPRDRRPRQAPRRRLETAR